MKKRISLIFAIVLLINFLITKNMVFAQKISKENKKLAKELCQCGDKMLNALPKIFKDMLIDITNLGEEKAIEKLMENMGKMTEKEKKDMENFEQNDKDFEKKWEQACKEPEMAFGKKNETEKNQILEIMKKDKKCQLSYAMRYLMSKNKGRSEPAYNPSEEKK